MKNQMADSELVARLAEARRTGQQIHDLPNDLVPSSNAQGYEAAAAIEKTLGWAPLGWKIAGTTAAVREKLRIDTPIYGRTYQKYKSTSPCRLDRRDLLDPIIECEFFVTLAKGLDARDEPWRMEDVTAAIGDVHAGIEVAECRFPGAALPPLPAILADGAASGRYVFGNPIANWRDGLAEIAVNLEVDGRPRRQGAGSDVMGDPLAPLHWLAETLRGLGRGLAAGEMVSTGSCTGMLPLRDSRHIVAHFGNSARVEIAFDG